MTTRVAWACAETGKVALVGRSYPEVVVTMVAPFAAPFFHADEIGAMAESNYARFRHPEVAPLVRLGDDDWLLDLTWGPTLSFKDYAMALLGAMMEAAVERTGERVLVLGATSGDTGSAAIEALRGRTGIDVVILYPEGRISDIQRRQMTTVEESNVHAVAIHGTFDDCQDLAKALLADPDLAPKHRLAGFNSINWARDRPPRPHSLPGRWHGWEYHQANWCSRFRPETSATSMRRTPLRRWGSRWANWLSGPTATTG